MEGQYGFLLLVGWRVLLLVSGGIGNWKPEILGFEILGIVLVLVMSVKLLLEKKLIIEKLSYLNNDHIVQYCRHTGKG